MTNDEISLITPCGIFKDRNLQYYIAASYCTSLIIKVIDSTVLCAIKL
jgi:hypothetical protein